MKKEIGLVIGLGNPDEKYSGTYHNIGHFFIDTMEKLKIENLNLKNLKTDVFMNHSGEFVKKELKKANCKPENMLIVHDDSDIELGQLKFSFGRGSAGHKGVQNIIDQLKTNEFWRLRIGIRNPNEKIRQKSNEFVMKKISPTNKKVFESLFKNALDQLE